MLFTAVVASVGLVAACSAAPQEVAAPAPTPFVVPTTTPTPAAAPTGEAPDWTAVSGRAQRVATVAAPTEIALPTIGVTADIVPVRVDADGVLGVPENPSTVGWWRRGAAPGDPEGTVVLDVHLDSRTYGRGPFAAATSLRRGDDVVVTDKAGVDHTYEVSGVTTYKKTALPYEELFTQDGPPRMVLVTCGGQYRASQGGWDSNVVVVFEPVARR
jgi:hypothetical protein